MLHPTVKWGLGLGAGLLLALGASADTTIQGPIKFASPDFAVSGNRVRAGPLVGTGTVTSVDLGVPAGSIFGSEGGPVNDIGVLDLTTTGSAGGLLYFGSPSQVLSSGSLSGLVLMNGPSGPSSYGGTDCGSQFIRSLNADADASCGSIPALANLTALDSTITLSGAYNGSVARTVAVNRASDFTWTGTHKFGAVFGRKGNGGADITGTTYTVSVDDCGTNLVTTNSSTVTFTIPASLISGSDTCAFAVWQADSGNVYFDGTAVPRASVVSYPGWTHTAGQNAMVGISVMDVAGTTTANLTGNGAP